MKLFFKLAIRNFLKSKGLNAFNIIGLAMGMVAATLVILYADHELHYDQFHNKASNIYRLEGKTNGDQWFAYLGMEHGKELAAGKYPEVIDRTILNVGQKAFLEYGNKKLAEKNIHKTDPGSNFFEFFDFNVLEGNEETLLEAPYSVVLTQSAADRFFEDESAIGKTLQLDTILLNVTGVIENIPSNSHLDFEILYTDPRLYNREHFHTYTYLHLHPDVKPSYLRSKILAMEGVAFNDYHELSDVRLIKLPDIYLTSDAAFGSAGKGDLVQVIVFLVIGALILFIAIANYVNLSLAMYLNKGREIGVRKVFGESRAHIVRVAISESLIVMLLVVPLVALGLYVTVPVFNELLGVSLEQKLLSSTYVLSAIGLLITIAVLTVLYPASSLARTKTSMLIKSKSAMNITGGIRYRSLLIFTQFVLLFTLGISAFLMNRQIQYMDTKDMGFDATGVLKIINAYEIGEFKNYELLKTKLLAFPQIEGVAFGPMMGDSMNPLTYKPEGQDETFENLLSYGVDIDYFDVMGMELTHGDFKNVLQASEAGQIVSLVNHSFLNRFGWQEDPIGKKIILRPGTENELNRKVSGVFKDFHFYTLKEKITPHIISLRPDPQFVNTNVLIRINGNLPEVVKIIEDQWYTIKPDLPLEYELMDEAVKELYAKERQTSQVSLSFSMLAIDRKSVV